MIVKEGAQVYLFDVSVINNVIENDTEANLSYGFLERIRFIWIQKGKIGL
jgi:hypothetical protein